MSDLFYAVSDSGRSVRQRTFVLFGLCREFTILSNVSNSNFKRFSRAVPLRGTTIANVACALCLSLSG